MASISWSAVWTAGATAVFVTLAIEYAAKPRLEARKEAILDALRARREVKALVMRLTMAAQKFCTMLPEGAEPKLEANWKVERDRHYSEMRAHILQLSDGLERYAGTYREPLLGLITNYGFNLYGIVLSLRPRRRQAEMIVEFGPPMLKALDFPAPWKLWRHAEWKQAVSDVRRLVAQPRQRASGPRLNR